MAPDRVDGGAPRLRIGIIGGGRVASAFAASLGAAHDVALWARRPGEVRLSTQAPGVGCSSEWADVASRPLIIVAVRDDAIESVAKELAGQLSGHGETVVLHTSGATTGARSLGPLLEVAGVQVGSVHPLLAVPVAAAPGFFRRAPFVLEAGGPLALSLARSLVSSLGGVPIELPDSSEGTKARYHAMATMVATGTVALVDRAAVAIGQSEGERAGFREAFGRLALTAASNASEGAGAEVLTGPVARRDHSTLERHDLALAELPVAELYAAIRRAALGMMREEAARGEATEEGAGADAPGEGDGGGER